MIFWQNECFFWKMIEICHLLQIAPPSVQIQHVVLSTKPLKKDLFSKINVTQVSKKCWEKSASEMEQPWQKLFFRRGPFYSSQQQNVIAMMMIPPKKIMKIALHTHSSLFFFSSPSYFSLLLWICMYFPNFFSGRWRWIAQIKTIQIKERMSTFMVINCDKFLLLEFLRIKNYTRREQGCPMVGPAAEIKWQGEDD